MGFGWSDLWKAPLAVATGGATEFFPETAVGGKQLYGAGGIIDPGKGARTAADGATAAAAAQKAAADLAWQRAQAAIPQIQQQWNPYNALYNKIYGAGSAWGFGGGGAPAGPQVQAVARNMQASQSVNPSGDTATSRAALRNGTPLAPPAAPSYDALVTQLRRPTPGQ